MKTNNYRITPRRAPISVPEVFICALGYESRAVHCARTLAPKAARRVAFSFDSAGAAGFDENKAFLSSLDFEIVSLSNSQWVDYLQAVLGSASRIIVDISCFTRLHLAQILDAALEAKASVGGDVDFVYAPASSLGWEAELSQLEVAEPVHPTFTSWVDDVSLPLAVVIGVGAEEDLALGVVEHLDASIVLSLSPAGSDDKFDDLNARANRDFFVADYVVESSDYDVLDPTSLLFRVESIVYGLADEYRVALVPLGPKIFALCALIVAGNSGGSVTVWRFSPGDSASQIDRFPAGPVVALPLSITPYGA